MGFCWWRCCRNSMQKGRFSHNPVKCSKQKKGGNCFFAIQSNKCRGIRLIGVLFRVYVCVYVSVCRLICMKGRRYCFCTGTRVFVQTPEEKWEAIWHLDQGPQIRSLGGEGLASSHNTALPTIIKMAWHVEISPVVRLLHICNIPLWLEGICQQNRRDNYWKFPFSLSHKAHWTLQCWWYVW